MASCFKLVYPHLGTHKQNSDNQATVSWKCPQIACDCESSFPKLRTCNCQLFCFNCDNYLPQLSGETLYLSLVFSKSKDEQLMMLSFFQTLHQLAPYGAAVRTLSRCVSDYLITNPKHPPVLPQKLMALLPQP